MHLYRGILVAFDSIAYTASVRLDGSGAQAISGIPASRALPSAEMIAGRVVLVHLGEPRSPASSSVIAVFS